MICFVFFFLATFLIQITIMNMLIAIMSETFSNVIDKKPIYSLQNKIKILGDIAGMI